MKTLLQSKKITLATAKAFVTRNRNNLFVKVTSDFDGMTDCVQSVEDTFKPATFIDDTNHYLCGISKVYIVGSSRDYFRLYEGLNYVGIVVSNSCGSSILVTSKNSNF